METTIKPAPNVWTGMLLAGMLAGSIAWAGTDPDDHNPVGPPVVTAIAMDPKGATFATAGDDHRIRIWDLAHGRLLRTLHAHRDWVTAVTYSADGSEIYSAAEDGQVLAWQVGSDSPPKVLLQQRTPYTSLSRLGGSEALLAVGFRCPLQFAGDMASSSALGQPLECPCEDMRVVAASPDGTQFAAGGRNGRIRIWSRDDGRVLHELEAHDQRLRALVYTPDGTRLVSAGEDRAICVWDPVSGTELRHINRSKGKILCLAALDETRLAAGTSENVIDLWDMVSGESIGSLEGHTGSVSAMAQRGSRLISGSYDATVRWWDVTPGTPAVALGIVGEPRSTVRR